MTSLHRRSSSTVVATVGALWLSFAFGGCGGRTLGVPHADGGAAGNTQPTGTGTGGEASGGSQGQAGAVTGEAGVSGGSAGISGGSAGAGGGPPCLCPTIGCATGFVPTPDPASCCPVCKPIVCNGACTVPTCSPDSHLEKAPGQCCATCMPGMNDRACTAGQQQYAADRAATVEKYTEGGCTSDDDCALFYERNQCAWTCGTAVNADLVMDATSNLDQAATFDCGTCPPSVVSPGCPLLTALCSNGKCVSGTPPTR